MQLRQMSPLNLKFGYRVLILAIPVLLTLLFLLNQPVQAATHTVQNGESLYKISQKYGVPITQIQSANSLSAKSVIKPGQVLNLPSTYQVVKGDSWYKISQKFGISLDQLKRLNPQKGNMLHSGDSLWVPGQNDSTTKTKEKGFGITDAELKLLAQVIYGEARGESYTGQVAVAAVILNRVRAQGFPNSINGVVFQSRAFCSVREGSIWVEPNKTQIDAARDAAAGWDPSGGALYFYNPDKPCGAWIFTRSVLKRIDNHLFAI